MLCSLSFHIEVTMRLLIIFVCAISTALCSEDYNANDIINQVNTKRSTWRAGKNFDEGTPRTYLQQLAGVRPDWVENTVLEVQSPETLVGGISIPQTFDAREAWPDCPSIGRISDQSSCGSCWAVSIAEVLTDRMCIHKNQQFNISAEDLLSCCKKCGSGCNGGYPQQALDYFVDEGIVSGGSYGSNKGCKPYSIPPCQRDSSHSCSMVSTPKCEKKCRNGYSTSYDQDKASGRVAYQIESDVRKIQKEIVKNGPVQASFKVYEDFYNYKSGVYQHIVGKQRGGHAVKIIGWGKENGADYWLVANSWGRHWGEDGFFKILRGNDEVQIETQVNAAIP